MWYKRNLFHFYHSCHRDHFPTTLRQPMSVAKKLAPNPSTVDAKRLLGSSDKEVTRLIVVRHPFNRCHNNQSRGIWFPALVFRLVSAFRDKLERCHSVRKGQCYLKTDYYYNRSNENFQTDCVLGQTKEKILFETYTLFLPKIWKRYSEETKVFLPSKI